MSQNHRPTIDGREFQRLREHMKLSRDMLAIELGYEGSETQNRKTIKRFETNERPVPLPVAKLAWILSVKGIPESWPSGLEAVVSEESDG